MNEVYFDYDLQHYGKVTVRASCRAFVGYEVIGLNFYFLDDSGDIIMDIKYDKDIFDDVSESAIKELTDDHFNRETDRYMRKH